MLGMFRFTIRDVLWLTVVIALAIVCWNDRRTWHVEKQLLMEQRDNDVANERRLAELKARELAGQFISRPLYGREFPAQRPPLRRQLKQVPTPKTPLQR